MKGKPLQPPATQPSRRCWVENYYSYTRAFLLSSCARQGKARQKKERERTEIGFLLYGSLFTLAPFSPHTYNPPHAQYSTASLIYGNWRILATSERDLLPTSYNPFQPMPSPRCCCCCCCEIDFIMWQFDSRRTRRQKFYTVSKSI